MDEAVYDRERHGLAWKDLSPFAERLVGGDEQGPVLVTGADQFEQNARLRLILGDIGEIVENLSLIHISEPTRPY